MSENSKSNESWFTKATRRFLPLLFSMPLVIGADRGETPKPVEPDPNPAGLPTETTPAQLPRNSDGMVEIKLPPLLPVNWQEDPRYADDRFTVRFQDGRDYEFSRQLLIDQNIVLNVVSTEEDGIDTVEWRYDQEPSTPHQDLPNAVRGAFDSQDPTPVPVAEIAQTPEPDLPQHTGYLPVMDMEIQTRNGEQVVRFFIQHPDAAPGAGSYIVEVNPDSVVFSDGTTAAYEDYKARRPSIQFDGEIPSLEDAQQPIRPILVEDHVAIFNGESAPEPATGGTPANAEIAP